VHCDGSVLLLNVLASECLLRAKVVHLLLSKDPVKAIELVSQHYRIAKPKLRVGMPKRHSKKLACYVANNRTIYVSNRDFLSNPHVILHEFYHHLRNSTSTQKGLEKHADRFAGDFLKAYNMVTAYDALTTKIRDW
jgi:hypothetical protein